MRQKRINDRKRFFFSFKNTNFIVKIFFIYQELCNKKFTYLQTTSADLNNFYSNKQILQTLVPTNQSCYYDYGVFNEEKSDFGFRWSSLDNSTTKSPLLNLFSTKNAINVSNSTNFTTPSPITFSTQNNEYMNSNLSTSFRFTKSKYLKDNPFSGQYGNYLGGGYVYRMSSDFNTVINDLELLQSMNWIDRNTRAVFFEFTLFNPNIKLFCSVKMLFEILPSGGIIPIISFSTMNLWTTSREVMVTGIMSAYLVVVIVLMANEIKALSKMKKAYFKQFWPYVNWSLFALTWTALPLYIYKIYSQHDISNQVEKNSISYMNSY